MGRKRKRKPRASGYRSRPWTQEEDQLIAQNIEMPRRRLAELLRRSHLSIRLRINTLGLTCPKIGVARCVSQRTISYDGPPGWEISQGPPCLLCIYHHYKIANDFSDDLRRQCQECLARVMWDIANSGYPVRVKEVDDPTIYWVPEVVHAQFI